MVLWLFFISFGTLGAKSQTGNDTNVQSPLHLVTHHSLHTNVGTDVLLQCEYLLPIHTTTREHGDIANDKPLCA